MGGKKSADDILQLSDYRLAQAFDFTWSDLTANRSGFISWGQTWGLGRRGQKWLHSVVPFLTRRFARPRLDEKVTPVCGRIRLRYHQEDRQRQTQRQEYHQLQIENLVFRLTPQQYGILVDNVSYRIFYQDNRILSLERAADDCRKSDEAQVNSV